VSRSPPMGLLICALLVPLPARVGISESMAARVASAQCEGTKREHAEGAKLKSWDVGIPSCHGHAKVFAT